MEVYRTEDYVYYYTGDENSAWKYSLSSYINDYTMNPDNYPEIKVFRIIKPPPPFIDTRISNESSNVFFPLPPPPSNFNTRPARPHPPAPSEVPFPFKFLN